MLTIPSGSHKNNFGFSLVRTKDGKMPIIFLRVHFSDFSQKILPEQAVVVWIRQIVCLKGATLEATLTPSGFEGGT